MIQVNLGEVKKDKRLGKYNSGDGVGAGFYNLDCEVTKAEYAKNKEGKEIKSEKGSKLINLNCKINDGKYDTFFNVKYYETDFSPKFKDILPTDKLKKFARISLSNGGSGFGSFRISNYVKDGKSKSNIEVYGANVNKAIKEESGKYVIKIQDDTHDFEASKVFNLSVKGIFEHIDDTEYFMQNNYDENKKILKLKLYCFENSEAIPVVFENLEKERALTLCGRLKEYNNKVCGINGDIKKYFSKVKSEVKVTDEFEAESSDGFDIFTAICVGTNDTGKYKFKGLENAGVLTVSNEGAINETEPKAIADNADDFVF